MIHTTSDLLKCLRDLKSLLRPGGKMIMMETTVDNIRDGIIFGLLPGWWMREGHWWEGEVDAQQPGAGEDEALGPILTEDGWDAALRTAGFSGVDMVFRDNEWKPRHRVSTLVTTRPEEDLNPEAVDENMIILADRSSALQATNADALKEKLSSISWVRKAEICRLDELEDQLEFSNTRIISLLEIDQSFLGNINASQFRLLKKIGLDSKTVLWLTCGGCPGSKNPAAEIAVGFSRSLCSERGDQSFVTLNLETADVDEGVEHILRVLKHFHQAGTQSTASESEYSVQNGLIHIPRIVPQKSVNETLAARSGLPEKETFTLGQQGTKPRIGLTIQQPGLLDTLYYTELNSNDTELHEGEVEIEVKAASLNFRDVMIGLGQVPGDGLGLEGSGVVIRTGPGTKLQKGDRVMYFIFSTGGCCGTYVRCTEVSTQKIPNGISFLDAAAIPAVWCTVVYAFDHVARLRKGESVLIHAGAGAVGQAANQLAKLRGAQIFVTVGSDWKRQLLKDLYGISDDQIFHSRENSFVDDVFHATGGRGVDVVLNSLGGELLQDSWKCTAPFGRFIDIGKADILANNTLEMGHFLRNILFAAVDVAGMYEENKPLMRQVLDDVFELFEAHPHLHNPKPLHAFPPSKVEDAMRALQGGKIAGKAVIDFEAAGDCLQYQPIRKPAYTFEGQATYVISGGLGGLGREIMRWMASRGARHFLVTSSRGVAGRSDVIAFVQEMEERGIQILAPASDISNRALLEATLKEAQNKLPPIKGCIQAAMVLEDNMLSNMTVEQFHRALGPKYQGSWNLHELLPKDMDFMVFLSSMSGIIGNPAQANYAAGNTFEDALARHRAASGLKGVSFDLGLVLEAGWASDNFEDVTKSLRAGLGGLTQAQLMAILDVLCDPTYDCTVTGAAQVVNIHDKPSKLYRMFQDGVLHWVGKPLFRNLLRQGQVELVEDDNDEQGEAAAVDYLALLRAAGDADEAGHIVTEALLGKLSKSLSVPTESLDVGKPAYVLGVDSLIAVELRYWFLKQFGVEVPVFIILKKQPTIELCQHVADQVLARIQC